MKKSRFKKWFIEQFGKRPSNKELCFLEGELLEAELDYKTKKYLFNVVKSWDEQFDTALKAWNANEKVES